MSRKFIFRIHNGQAAVEKGNAVLDGIENLLTEIGEGLLETTPKRKKWEERVFRRTCRSKTKVETTVLNDFESTFVTLSPVGLRVWKGKRLFVFLRRLIVYGLKVRNGKKAAFTYGYIYVYFPRSVAGFYLAPSKLYHTSTNNFCQVANLMLCKKERSMPTQLSNLVHQWSITNLFHIKRPHIP